MTKLGFTLISLLRKRLEKLFVYGEITKDNIFLFNSLLRLVKTIKEMNILRGVNYNATRNYRKNIYILISDKFRAIIRNLMLYLQSSAISDRTDTNKKEKIQTTF